MSSPRKYASPYLSTFPGMSSAPAKGKKKLKGSIKSNEPAILTHINESAEAEGFDQKCKCNSSVAQNATFDPSCGDVTDQKVLDLHKSVPFSPTDNTFDVKEEAPENNQDTGITGYGISGGAEALCTQTPSQDNQIKYEIGDRTCSEILDFGSHADVEETNIREKLTCSDDNIGVALKSILKKPSPYPSKVNMKFGPDTDAYRRHGKGSKQKTFKPFTTREQISVVPSRLMSKNTGKVFPPIPVPRRELQKSQQSAGTAKSPRKWSKTTATSKNMDKDPSVIPLSILRKSVRFSNKIDVYPVPYESRAGTRACDWQRNMLEQRVQSFRQLMKDVVSSEELDLFGSGGMLFPGYSYHVPNPHFALRGRARNFRM